MTVEERLTRVERNLDALARVQDQMMDLLGLTVEGERRLASRMERQEEMALRLESTVVEIADKLNGLIGYVDGLGK